MNSYSDASFGEVRSLATALGGLRKDTSNYASLRKGTLVSIETGTPNTYTITLSGNSSHEISGVYALDSYDPTVGDTVILGKQGGSLLILGTVGNYTGGGGGGVSYVYNVKDYGATGLGASTDDTNGFQSAIDAASTFASTSGVQAVVYAPADTYRIDSLVSLKDNVILDFRGAVLRSYDNTTTLFSTFGGSAENVTVLGGVFDAAGQDAATDVNYNIFTLQLASNVRFEGCTFRNVPGWHAIDMTECDGIHITDCRFEGFVDNTTGGTRGFSEAIQLDSDDTTGNTTNNVYVSGCYMGPAVDGSGLGSFGKLVGSHTNTVGKWYSNIQIVNNRVKSSNDVAIQGYSWTDAVISGNVIDSSGSDAIKMTQTVNNTAGRISVTGNVIRNGDARGIYFDGNASQVFRNCTIANNTIYNNTSAAFEAIRVDQFNYGSITGNQIYDCASHGIMVASSTDTNITSNNIANVDLSGVQIDGCTRVTVEGNKITEVGNRGIWIANSTTKSSFLNNTIIGAGRATTNTYGGIEISSSANTDNVISGNRIGKGPTSPDSDVALRPIHFAGSTSTGVQVGNNSYDGFTEKAIMVHTVTSSATSTTTDVWTNLSDGANPSITMTTGSTALVHFRTLAMSSASSATYCVGVAVSGASTVSADYGAQIDGLAASQKSSMGGFILFEGLTPGVNTFTVKYQLFTGTLTCEYRSLTVQPVCQ